jgi:hypothetical protein
MGIDFAKQRAGLLRVCRSGVALLLLIPAPRLQAQPYSVDWFKTAGGGGSSASGQYAISGTIGQHDAGTPMTGGGYSLTGGFWSLISTVQTPGAPALFFRLSGGNLTVYWQSVAGWNLQQNTNLHAASGWSSSSGVTTLNGTNSLTAARPPGNLFFRLAHP